ncbi:MAG TPA: DUF1326 domain-containing protein [Candidatus Eisenbacteria bacterium]|jgi:hypothetical protein
MFRLFLCLIAVCILGAPSASTAAGAAAAQDWSINATIIEACSCPMFCQCYFNPKPAPHGGHEGHGEEHFCRFNNAFQVNKGMFGNVKLDGAKFWISGDLGPEFSGGQMDWAVLTFDPAVTPEQREGIKAAVGAIYPVQWKSFTVAADAPMEWTHTADRAVARLDGGKAGEVVLHRFAGMTNEPVVIRNLKYWGASRNDGFVLMPNEVEAYRLGDKAFEYRGGNGFMITLDTSSKDAAAQPASKQ